MSRILAIGMMLSAIGLAFPASATSYSYLVFFDSGSVGLDVRSIVTIQAFVGQCRPVGQDRIGLTGHTDSAEAAGHDPMLSLRRAEAVKQALVREGIPAGAIVTMGRGATQLLVHTGDALREPQNRRVEFVCQRVP